MTAAAKTRSPRPKCRHCGFPAANKAPLLNYHCSKACATAAIINAGERRMRAGR